MCFANPRQLCKQPSASYSVTNHSEAQLDRLQGFDASRNSPSHSESVSQLVRQSVGHTPGYAWTGKPACRTILYKSGYLKAEGCFLKELTCFAPSTVTHCRGLPTLITYMLAAGCNVQRITGQRVVACGSQQHGRFEIQEHVCAELPCWALSK